MSNKIYPHKASFFWRDDHVVVLTLVWEERDDSVDADTTILLREGDQVKGLAFESFKGKPFGVVVMDPHQETAFFDV